jgi:hypothetical protein
VIRQRNRQTYAILTFVALLGPGTLEWFPGWLARAHTSVWLLLLVWGVVILVLGWLAISAAANCPDNRSITGLLETVLGRLWGGLFNVLWAFILCLYGAKVLHSGIELIHYDVLPYTPTLVMVVMCLLIPLQLSVGGFDALLRFLTVLFWPALILAVAMSILCFRRGDFANLLPLWTLNARQLVSALPFSLQLLPGWLLIVLYTPLFSGSNISSAATFRTYVLGGAGVFLLIALDLGVVLTNFGAFEGAALRWPVIEAMRMQFGIRLDVINLIPVLIAVSGVFNLYVYGAYVLVHPYLRMHGTTLYSGVLAVCGALAVIPDFFHTAPSVYEVIACGFVCLLAVILVAGIAVRHGPGSKRRMVGR